ncbi:MAG: hypothetical protein ACFFCQ_06980 [Promethearchaeota archaeon]
MLREGQKIRSKEKIDPNDPRLKYFSRDLLKRLNRSGLTIDAFKKRIFKVVEAKITEKKFRKLYFDEREPLSLTAISKIFHNKPEYLSLWVKDKLGIKIRPRGNSGAKNRIKKEIDLNDRQLKHFSRNHIKRFRSSNLSIEAWKERIFKNIEAKITEEEFKKLYFHEKEPLSLTAISKRKKVSVDDLSLWVKDKLDIKIKPGGYKAFACHFKEKIDPSDSRLTHFDKKNLEKLKESGLTIDDWKIRLFNRVETKITDEKFKKLYFNEENPLDIRTISKRIHISSADLALWVKDKLGIKLRRKGANGATRRINEKIDPSDPRLKYFSKVQLKRLKKSSLTIDAWKKWVFKKIEFKITEKEFRKLYFNEKSPLTLETISKRIHINPEDLALWTKDKLGIELRYRGMKKVYERTKENIDLKDPQLKHFTKNNLKNLKRSSLTIKGFKARVFGKVKAKISEKEFKKLYFNEKRPLREINRIIHISYDYLALWAKEKLGIETITVISTEYIERYKNGEGAHSLSKELGMSASTFLIALERVGVKKRDFEEAMKTYYDLLPKFEIPPEYIERYKKGESMSTLAKELEISPSTFLKAIDRTPEIDRRTHEDAMDLFMHLVPMEVLERYEKGENPEILAKELGIGYESFMKCATVLTKEWIKWEETTERIAKEIHPHAKFQTTYDWGIPDIEFTEDSLKKIADAKLNGENLGDTIKKYAALCDILEFWYLRNPQRDFIDIDTITQKRTNVVFRTPQQLLARIEDTKKREELKKILTERFHLKFPRKLDRFLDQ